MPISLASWEADVARISVQCQPRKIVLEIPSSKQPEQNELEMWLELQSACFTSTKP
jgi:hypothetical protein